MTAKRIVETADNIRIIGTGYADLYEYSAFSHVWCVNEVRIDFDYVLSNIERAIREQGVRIFRNYDDGITTITIINDIGEEI
nr:MAG TPA: hypothetical protein [Caudoviricetes sp.]